MQMLRRNVRGNSLAIAAILSGLFGGKSSVADMQSIIPETKVWRGPVYSGSIRQAKMRNIKRGQKNGKPRKR